MREFRMPKLALGEGDRMTVLSWLVSEGDEFDEGQVLLEVETDKATMEVDAPFPGQLARILCGEGADVEPGGILGWVAQPGEEYDREDLQEPVDGQKSPVETAPDRGPAPGDGDGRHLVEAASVSGARSIADRNHTVPGDMRGFPASSPDESPPAAARRSPPAADPEAEGAGPYQTAALTRHRQAVTRSMERSNQVPQFAVFRDLDVGAARGILQNARDAYPGVTFSDLLLTVVARTLATHPALNAWFTDAGILRFEEANICLAVDGPDGVVGPVIRSTQRLGLGELVAERSRLVEGARAGKLDNRDLQGGTFTLSNIGPLDADGLLPMLTPPQVAILAVGRIRIEDVISGTLVGDHRVIDGADGARFLTSVDEELKRLETTIGLAENRHRRAEE